MLSSVRIATSLACLLLATGALAGGKPVNQTSITAWQARQFAASYLKISPPDRAASARYLRKAADLGDIWAAYDYAELARKGDVVPKSLAEAIKYYKVGLPRNKWSSFQLGELYRNGNGVPRDLAKARQLLEPAAELDNAWPKIGLAEVLLVSSTPADKARGVELLKAAKAMGNEYASRKFTEVCSRMNCG